MILDVHDHFFRVQNESFDVCHGDSVCSLLGAKLEMFLNVRQGLKCWECAIPINIGGNCVETVLVCMSSVCELWSRYNLVGVVTKLWKVQSWVDFRFSGTSRPDL
jgi:hypothetical protein